jgi:hypothetical protein
VVEFPEKRRKRVRRYRSRGNRQKMKKSGLIKELFTDRELIWRMWRDAALFASVSDTFLGKDVPKEVSDWLFARVSPFER